MSKKPKQSPRHNKSISTTSKTSFDRDEFQFYLLAKVGAFPFLKGKLTDLDSRYGERLAQIRSR